MSAESSVLHALTEARRVNDPPKSICRSVSFAGRFDTPPFARGRMKWMRKMATTAMGT
jgi:hypothetical protein